MLPALLPLFLSTPESWSKDEVRLLLTELITYHAPLQHGFEVAWSLWVARALLIDLPESVSAAVRKMDDDIVALVALDMEEQSLIPPTNSSLWKSRMSKEHLYSEHWLLAYEGYVHGWLPSLNGKDYISDDTFFKILQAAGVRFYDVEEPWEDGYSDYSDGDDGEQELDDDEDDEEMEDDFLVPSFPNPFSAAPIAPPWADMPILIDDL